MLSPGIPESFPCNCELYSLEFMKSVSDSSVVGQGRHLSWHILRQRQALSKICMGDPWACLKVQVIYARIYHTYAHY